MTARGRTRAGRAVAVVAAAVTLAAAGCASTRSSGAPHTVHVEVSESGAVSLNGERLPLARLPRALKRQGARAETGIVIAIPGNTPYGLMEDITETLATAGLPRVMFTKPRQAVGEVKSRP